MTELSTQSPESTKQLDLETAQTSTQSAKLVNLTAGCELFHTSLPDSFITCPVENHTDTYRLHSNDFKTWLRHAMYTSCGSTPMPQAIDSAVNLLHGKALFDGLKQDVHVRVAGHEGDIYIDLGDAEWRVVRVSAEAGYTVLLHSPVKFKRPLGLLSLPEPQRGGCIEDLRPFVNVRDEHQWRLLVAFLVGALRPTGPYAVLELNGGQGSGKSVMTKILRLLVDPNTAPVRSLGNQRELALAANNGWVVAFDNISYIPKAMSNALCRVSTGGASSWRTLYENDGETLFEAQRPLILNGIGDFIKESDLLDRTLVLELPTIRGVQRQDERQFWKRFTEAQPRIFGALLDAVSGAMRNIDSVPERPDWPRMMDFAKWSTAAEERLGWPAGSFMDAYNANRQEANGRVIEDDPFALAIIQLADTRDWSGTATELSAEINPSGGPEFPRGANALKHRLTELKPNLEAAGVSVHCNREGGESRKMIHIGKRILQTAA